MKKTLKKKLAPLFFLGLFSCSAASAQVVSDSTLGTEPPAAQEGHLIDTVRIKRRPTRMPSTRVEPIVPEDDKKSAALNLTDWLARMPGVSQLTTGAAIAKPVLRGLYGNRVLVLLNGLRLDAQQWQDEHGLGLSQIGVERITVVRTGASALYGTEAVGGAILIYDETADSASEVWDATIRLRTGTLGTLSDVGYANGKGRLRYHVRAGVESGADYREGGQARVLNSRYAGYYLKGGAGWKRGRWEQYNHYNFSYNQYGFILEDLVGFFTPDARGSRAMEGPHHNVLLNVFSSNNRIRLRGSELEINAGGQSNRRAEDEGGGAISLDVHLLSGAQNATWTRDFGRGWKLTAREAFLYQDNTNLGKRVLIPDARISEAHAGIQIEKSIREQWRFSLASGATSRSITTFQTGMLNGASSEIAPFAIRRTTGNMSAWIQHLPNSRSSLALGITTGARAPNLAELSSYGVHEGTFRYEIGDAALRTERNLMAEISSQLSFGGYQRAGQTFSMEAHGFYNRFQNYIFLAPTGEKKFGFDVHRYFQTDAALWGGEVGTVVRFGSSRNSGVLLQWKETLACVFSEQADGTALPNIPPPQLRSSLYVYFKDGRRIRQPFIAPEAEYNAPQHRIAPFELASNGYTLVNLTGGLSTTRGSRTFDLTLSARNLLDKRYAAHLSRLRYYGIADPGVNVVLAIHTSLGF